MKTIFDSAELAGLRLKNRLFRSATWIALCEPDGTPKEELYEIYRELAAGGVGTIFTELTDVSAWNTAMGDNMRLYSDDLIPAYARLAELIHQYGAVAIPQLNIYQYARSEAPHTIVDVDDLTEADLADIRRLYIEGAVRAAKCGFDGVQLHLAYGWLLYRFLNPARNHRTDAYGGGPEGRCRIVTEIIQGIKRELPGIPICGKISFYADENGYRKEDCAAICRILYENGLDFIEIVGDHSPMEKGNRYESYYADLAEAVRRVCDIPIVLTGGNNSVEGMEQLLNERGIPYFGLSRPLIREPDLPRRWESGDRAKAACVHCDGCYRTPGKRCRFTQGGAK